MDFGGSVAAVHDPDAEWNDLTDLCAIGGDPLVGSEEEAGACDVGRTLFLLCHTLAQTTSAKNSLMCTVYTVQYTLSVLNMWAASSVIRLTDRVGALSYSYLLLYELLG